MTPPYVFLDAHAHGAVRIELHGDRQLAASHLHDARKLLGEVYRRYGIAERIAAGAPGGYYVGRKTLPDGTQLLATSNDGLDLVRILAGRVAPADRAALPPLQPLRTEQPILWLARSDGDAWEFDPGALRFTGRRAVGMGGGAGGGDALGTLQLLAAWDCLFALYDHYDGHLGSRIPRLRRVRLDQPATENGTRLDIDLDITVDLDGIPRTHLDRWMLVGADRRLFVIGQEDALGYFRLHIQQVDADSFALLGRPDVLSPADYPRGLPLSGHAAVVEQQAGGQLRRRLLFPSAREAQSTGYTSHTNPNNPMAGPSGSFAVWYDIDTRETGLDRLPYHDGAIANMIDLQSATSTRTHDYYATGMEKPAFHNVAGPAGIAVDFDGELWLPTTRLDNVVDTAFSYAPGTSAYNHYPDTETVTLRRAAGADPVADRIALERTARFQHWLSAPSTFNDYRFTNPTVAVTDTFAVLTYELNSGTRMVALERTRGDHLDAALYAPIQVRQLVATDGRVFGIGRHMDGNTHVGYPFFSIAPALAEQRFVSAQHDPGQGAWYTRIAVHWERVNLPPQPAAAPPPAALPPELSDDAYWHWRMVKTTNHLTY